MKSRISVLYLISITCTNENIAAYLPLSKVQAMLKKEKKIMYAMGKKAYFPSVKPRFMSPSLPPVAQETTPLGFTSGK